MNFFSNLIKKIKDTFKSTNQLTQIKDITKDSIQKIDLEKISATTNDYINKIDDKLKNLNIKKSDEEIALNYFKIDYIYHMTHLKNIKSILKNGLLSHNNKFAQVNIDNPDVNSLRNYLEPIYNKNVQEYVPFYFNPKNAMLYVNRHIQRDIIILAFDRKLIHQEGSIYTDGNASIGNTKFYNKLEDLKNLNWECINAKYWNDIKDGKRTRMSEVLVFNHVPIEFNLKIYCSNKGTKSYLDTFISKYTNIDVEVNKNLFF